MIINHQHPKEIFLYGSATLLERAAYYGIRALIVLYMIGETLNMERSDALMVYGILTGVLTITSIVGAILGDILLGNKTAIFIGGLLQAVGAFFLCFNSMTGLYIGIGFIAFGTGLYKFNMLSQIGKLYFTKGALSDAGFTIYYIALNLGAALGIMAIGILGEKYGYQYGFLLGGLLLLLSSCIIFFTPAKATEIQDFYKENKAQISLTIAILAIVGGAIGAMMFWYIAGSSNEIIYLLRYNLIEQTVVSWSNLLWDSFNIIFLFFFGILLIFAWSVFKPRSRLIKLVLGFLFLACSLILLYLLSESSELVQMTAFLLVVVLCLQSLSELFVAPIINALVSRFSNPKYLATIFALVFLPTNAFVSFLTGIHRDVFGENMSELLIALFILTFIICIVLLVAFLLKKTIRLK